MNMKNPSKFQKARVSTESVMTPTPVQGNTHSYATANRNQGQVINGSIDKPISSAHKDYDTDLARDNLENDNTAADLLDL